MGAMLSNDFNVKVDLYKWSSAEFPDEYALIYTSRDDEFSTCTFRLSANRHRVLCTLHDCLCEDEPIRLLAEVKAIRDKNGDFKFEALKFDSDGNFADKQRLPGSMFFQYGCDKRNCLYMVYGHEKIGHANKKKPTLVFSHMYIRPIKTSLSFDVNIQCDKGKGLCVEFSGPFKVKGVLEQERAGVHIDRKILGEPPKASDPIVKSEFKGEVYAISLGEGGEANNTPTFVMSAKGLVNNGGLTQGNFNGSVFTQCQFLSSTHSCSSVHRN